MLYILLICSLLLMVYFVIRCYLIKKSLKEVNNELRDIQKDIKGNQVVHLPMPTKDLEALIATINEALEEIRRERITYAKRERDFQTQIEAISHDLRTPVTVILGYLKLLKKESETSAVLFTSEQEDMLKITVRKAEAMEKLIAQFYDYSRIIAGDYEIAMDKIDVSQILREVFTDNCLILEEANLKVDINCPDYPIWVMGDRDGLERILINLFQNIGRYANSYVKIGISENDKKAKLFFENDTDKLSSQDIPNLFERFYMKDGSRGQGGSGLGLTIAKSLAEEMEGVLSVGVIDKENNNDNIIICFTLELASLE